MKSNQLRILLRTFSFVCNCICLQMLLTLFYKSDFTYYKRFFFLTNISQLLTFTYSFSILIHEVIEQLSPSKPSRSSANHIKAFLFLMPISLIVMIGYWQLILTDPSKLIRKDLDISPYSPYFMYIHGGNTLLLSTELLFLNLSPMFYHSNRSLFSPVNRIITNLNFFFSYCVLQYLHTILFNSHVYPFMEVFTASQFIFLYSQMITMTLLFDYLIIKCITHKLTTSTSTNNNKEKEKVKVKE